jgi:hypothetical protein
MSVSTELLEETASEAETLYTVVKAKDETGSWKEVADIISISATGAGFYIQRECQVGTLVNLMLPLAPHLRAYDHDKELYRVWGLVQHNQPLSRDDGAGYHVGVAFIGKNVPESYREDPSQNYKISGMHEDGLWKVTESKTAFKPRRHIRYWTAVDLYLALVDKKKDQIAGEKTVTENISRSGAAVISNLDVSVGDRVKFISEQFDFSGLAVVCNRQKGTDGKTRLHLQFVESTFPVESLDLKKTKPPAEK